MERSAPGAMGLEANGQQIHHACRPHIEWSTDLPHEKRSRLRANTVVRAMMLKWCAKIEQQLRAPIGQRRLRGSAPGDDTVAACSRRRRHPHTVKPSDGSAVGHS